MMQALYCFFGYHLLVADFNARYDICTACHKRIRAV